MLFKYNAIVVFVVALSYQILSLPYVKKKVTAKFLIPVVLTLLCCVCFFPDQGIIVILQKTIEFSGKSLIFNEIYKNVRRGVKP
jgi:hypothetical protein